MLPDGPISNDVALTALLSACPLLAVWVPGAARESSGHPSEFVLDAARQYALNEYESHYSRPISMYANILPPIGFIGTTGGLLILFFSMRVSSDSLELGALALALTSSLFALVAFAVLEGMKIRSYRRLLAGLDHAASLWRSGSRGTPSRSA